MKTIDLKDFTKEELIALKDKVYKAIRDFKKIKKNKPHISAFEIEA